ncbi:MAG: PIN domain-containing protein [Ornithinimicrobium sp.]
MSEIVLLDACVLVPYNLSSLLLALAEEGLYEPRWSEHILEETERALVHKLGQPADDMARRLKAMRWAFPEATVHGYEWMEAGLECHPKDRHVLAAAVASGAGILVTTNVKDFPDDACDPHDVVVMHPEAFLFTLLNDDIAACAEAIERYAARKSRPPMTTQELLAGLTDIAPTFANLIHQVLLVGVEPSSNIPALVAAADDESPVAEWSRNFDATDPLHVALTWLTALEDRGQYTNALHTLTHDPKAFGDYAWCEALLHDLAIVSGVYYAVDAPDRVAFLRFVPGVSETSQVFAAFTTRNGAFMTLCKYEDGTWRVWGVGEAMIGARKVVRNETSTP